MSIEALVQESQNLHARKYDLFGKTPVRGDGFRDLGLTSKRLGDETQRVRGDTMALDFSTKVGGGYGRFTGGDHLPVFNFGISADKGGDAADVSADINQRGAADVAAASQAEIDEIAAVPDPQSPEGKAAILAIIAKYHGKSDGTVENSAAAEQSNGAKAADDSHEHDKHDSDSDSSKDDSGMGSGGGLLESLLQSLIGGGSGMGSGMGGMNGMSPSSPFGQAGMDPYGAGAQPAASMTPAADPFANPIGAGAGGGAGATPTGYNSAADPFANPPLLTNAATVTTDGTDNQGKDQNSNTGANSSTGGNTTSTAGNTQGTSNTTGPAASSSSGMDVSGFSTGTGDSVPADPAASGGTAGAKK